MPRQQCQLVGELTMLWKPDPHYDAARALPEWLRFHQACREQSGVHFDFPKKDGRDYVMTAFELEKVGGGWRSYSLATGRGRTILAAMQAAYEGAGRTFPAATEMLARGLSGEPNTPEPPSISAADELNTIESFDDLLG